MKVRTNVQTGGLALNQNCMRVSPKIRKIHLFPILTLICAGVLGAQTRPYYMGFTPWPFDSTNEAVQQTYQFLKTHGDIHAHHFDGGVPWPEMLADAPLLPKNIQDEWTFRKQQSTSAGVPMYLAITPLNFNRNGLAAYWGPNGYNQPLPSPWPGYRLNDTPVKTAFLNYAKRVVQFFQPKYLAIGIEVNVIISVNPWIWNDYVELNGYVYRELKKLYPTLTIFSTVQYEHLRGIADESKPNQWYQGLGAFTLLQASDILALSTYQYGAGRNPIASDYFNTAAFWAAWCGKRIAISEMGAMSQDVTFAGTYVHATEQDQLGFITFMLQEAFARNFLFVINFVPIDYDLLLATLSGIDAEVGKAWVYTGLQHSNGVPKPSLSVWDQYRSYQTR